MNESDSMVFYDAVTVGERGQVVIPQAARELYEIKPGSKLLVMGGMGPPGAPALLFLKAEWVGHYLRVLMEQLSGVEKFLKNPPDGQAKE
jgi:AbrB family looped-hinge helix DNA binding protein